MSEKRVMVCDWCGAEGKETGEWGIYYRQCRVEDPGAPAVPRWKPAESEDICPDCHDQVKSLREIIQEPSKAYSQPHED